MGKLEVYVQRTQDLTHIKFLYLGTVLETVSLREHLNTIVIAFGQKSGKLGHTMHCLRNLFRANTKVSCIYTSVHAHWINAIVSVDIMHCKQWSENDRKLWHSVHSQTVGEYGCLGINGNQGQIIWHIMNSKPLMAGCTIHVQFVS